MIISCQAKTSRGTSPQAKGHGRPGHRRSSSGLVLEMRRQLADNWQMRWRPSISAGVVQVSPFVILFICNPDVNPAWANLQELLGILKDPESFLALWLGYLIQLRIVRKAVMVMTWQLARKLVLPWQQYPYGRWPWKMWTKRSAKSVPEICWGARLAVWTVVCPGGWGICIPVNPSCWAQMFRHSWL